METESSSLIENFGAVNGFYLKTVKNYSINHIGKSVESVEVTPTKSVRKISVSVFRWKMMLSSIKPASDGVSRGCQVCGDNGKTVFTFLERNVRSAALLGVPSVNKAKVVDVWIPTERKPIGWIQYGNEYLDNPVTMMDYSSQLILLMDKVDEHSIMKISDTKGTIIATLQPKKGMRKRVSGIIRWTDWKIKYAPPFSEMLPTTAKIITLTAFMLKINLYSTSGPVSHHI